MTVNTDSPCPIAATTVSQILELIVDLDAPLPSQLLSLPLRQRHHFLNITVDDPEQYLAWPGSGASNAVQVLKAFHRPPHDLNFRVNYSADPETLQAHVHITNSGDSSKDFRLVFQWDSVHGWQYHNIAFMPFPSTTYPNFNDALGLFRPSNDFLEEPSDIVSIVNPEDDDDDSYWNSYGQDDDSDPMSKGKAFKSHTPLNSEDAYWAQYSSVHGSADSTIPSPLPVKQSLDAHTQGDRVFVTSSSFQPNLSEPYNPLEAPSPDALAKRLAALSQRPASPPIEDEDDSTDSAITSPHQDAPELDSVDQASDQSPTLEDSIDEEPVVGESELALRQTIQGLFLLWKAEQQRKSKDSNPELFLSAVRQAIRT
ncbi:hypothetical protein FA15DRAFT_662425 [Coprinopsis marcescibilis]|uniref:Uncharacterized protein n=1 Tax=Coprinopsis marcescibilis TaxID=230819 RepID=A0A5C3LBM7_COPMA|nr:hypothetical protein FA15DRAFT_662425 [Coprinopsis marcescibilis]